MLYSNLWVTYYQMMRTSVLDHQWPIKALNTIENIYKPSEPLVRINYVIFCKFCMESYSFFLSWLNARKAAGSVAGIHIIR